MLKSKCHCGLHFTEVLTIQIKIKTECTLNLFLLLFNIIFKMNLVINLKFFWA